MVKISRLRRLGLGTLLFAMSVGSNPQASGADWECGGKMTALNPLKPGTSAPLGSIRYDQLKARHVWPAFVKGRKEVERRIRRLRELQAEPTFENTIVALEEIEDPWVDVVGLYDVFSRLTKTPEFEKLANKIKPELIRVRSQITFDSVIFARVKNVYDARDTLRLTEEQLTLLKTTYLRFVRNGALLDDAQKARLSEIDTRIALVAQKFEANVAAIMGSTFVSTEDPQDVEGIPEDALESSAALAAQQGLKGWAFSLSFGSSETVAVYAKSQKLRERIWRAKAEAGSSGPNDNRGVLLELARLREARAQIFGYPTHAAYILEDRMAEKTEVVDAMLAHLSSKYLEAAKEELADLREFSAKNLQGLVSPEIKPWDVKFARDRLQTANYAFESEKLREYFVLDNAIAGLFEMARRLYGLTFTLRKDVPVWDPLVRAYAVHDAKGEHLAVFYMDLFARPGKKEGAEMGALLEGGRVHGRARRPHVYNLMNLAVPTHDRPTLLSLDEVTTLFHEFGHGLQGMLGKSTYRSQFGTNVQYDAVEIASQFHENWVLVDEILDVMGRHYRTGQRIPAELVAKVRKANTFHAGMLGIRQLRFGILDWSWHARDFSQVKTAEDVEAFEHRTLEPFYEGTGPREFWAPMFHHLFADPVGYSAGYWGYKWSQMHSADAFERFELNGAFDPYWAERFRSSILERGGSAQARRIYREFQGRDADPDALLRSEGILPQGSAKAMP